MSAEVKENFTFWKERKKAQEASKTSRYMFNRLDHRPSAIKIPCCLCHVTPFFPLFFYLINKKYFFNPIS